MRLTCGIALVTAALSALVPSTHAEISGDPTPRTEQAGTMAPSSPATRHQMSLYSADTYWIGKGQGDLTKGSLVCQRVSELAARTDLAKQIRVFVKEHMVDRVRERSGRDPEQDIELTREELVQEYLQGVQIVDHHTDDAKQICTATAVMPKSAMPPSPPPDRPSPAVR